MADKIQLRRDTAANWASANPVLAIGEIGILIDADNKPLKLKLGDGTTAWSSLSFWISANSSTDDDNDLGYYATEALLIAAHETGTAGQYATIGETDTIWMWSVSSEAWVDTGLSGGDWVTMVHTSTEHTTIADDDELGVLSSANSWGLRRLKWSVIASAIASIVANILDIAGFITVVTTDGETITGSGTASDPLVANISETTIPYDLGFAISDAETPITTDNWDQRAIARACTISTLVASANVAPTGNSVVITFYQNGTSIGTVTLAIGELYATTTLTTAVSVAVGDIIKAAVTTSDGNEVCAGIKVEPLATL